MFHFSKNHLPTHNQFNGKGLALVIFIPSLIYITTTKSTHVCKPFEIPLMATSLMGQVSSSLLLLMHEDLNQCQVGVIAIELLSKDKGKDSQPNLLQLTVERVI
jgi:hypothetical protein